jgi:hypothetical protein
MTRIRSGLGQESLGLVGGLLSMLSSGTMLYVLVTDARARASPRTRMLITLAAIDFAFSITEICHFSNMIGNPTIDLGNIGYRWPLSQQVLLFWWFLTTCASWLWTAFIAEHIVFVATSGAKANLEDELKREKMYYIIWSGMMLCFGVPAFGYFSWGSVSSILKRENMV